MTIGELAAELRRDVATAPDGDRVVRIHLFGIRRARDLNGVPLKELVERAGIPSSYHVEVHKGMRLADHVVLRDDRNE
jgi:hypothetical protein